MRVRTTFHYCMFVFAFLIAAFCASAAENGQSLYINEFEDDGALVSLAVNPRAEKSMSINEGRLYLRYMGDKSRPSILLFPVSNEGGAYDIECDVTIYGSESGLAWAGLVFGAEDFDNYSLFAIHSYTRKANAAEFLRMEDGTLRSVAASALTGLKDRYPENLLLNPDKVAGNGIMLAQSEFHLRVRADGVNAYAYIDDVCVLAHAFDNAPSGAFGIASKGVNAFFDNASVRYIGEGSVVGPYFGWKDELYIPDTGVVAPPAIICAAESAGEELADAPRRPTSVILRVARDEDGALLCGGKPIADLALIRSPRVLPVFAVQTLNDAQALCDWADANSLRDAFVLSDHVFALRAAADGMLRGIYDATAFREFNMREIVRNANTAGARIVLIPQEWATQETIRALQSQFLTVYAMSAFDDERSLYNLLVSGCNGVVTGDFVKALDLLESMRERTLLRTPIAVAHRGNCLRIPENTLRALISAVTVGADSAELDVWMTSDGVLVLNHDQIVTVNGKFFDITKEPAETIQKARYTGWNSQPGDRVPTLEEVFDAISTASDRFTLEVEIKDFRSEVVDRVAELAERYDLSHRITLVSFDDGVLRYARENWPEYGTQWLTKAVSPKQTLPRLALATEMILRPLNSVYFPQINNMDHALADAFRARGVTAWPWALKNAPLIAKTMLGGSAGYTVDDAECLSDCIRYLKCEPMAGGAFRAVAVYCDGHTRDMTDQAEVVFDKDGYIAVRCLTSFGGARNSYYVYSPAIRH